MLVSVLAALTLLPALLGLLGPRVDSLRVIRRRNGGGVFWTRWSDWVMWHPVPVLVGTIALVVVFAGRCCASSPTSRRDGPAA